MPRKIAFIDVDNTTILNSTSELNQELIDFIAAGQFDQVYFVTGRNPNDLYQHVLHRGNPPPGWKNQLLHNVRQAYTDRGINFVGISTPFDSYFSTTQQPVFIRERDGTNTPHNITRAGEFAELVYIPFELGIATSGNTAPGNLVDSFTSLTCGNRYNNGLGENESLIVAMPMFLAVNSDTDKKSQFRLLLDRVTAENPGEMLDIIFFDDKPENLRQAAAVFAERPNIHSHATVEVREGVRNTAPCFLPLAIPPEVHARLIGHAAVPGASADRAAPYTGMRDRMFQPTDRAAAADRADAAVVPTAYLTDALIQEINVLYLPTQEQLNAIVTKIYHQYSTLDEPLKTLAFKSRSGEMKSVYEVLKNLSEAFILNLDGATAEARSSQEPRPSLSR